MRTGSTKVAPASSSQIKARKSLHPLQPAATDKENLVGAGRQLRSSLTGKSERKNEINGKLKSISADKPISAKNDPVKKIIAKAKVDSIRRASREIKKTSKETSIQTEEIRKVEDTIRDLTTEGEPSDNYWKDLAETRRQALENALEENRILSDQIRIYKEMLDESRALVEVLQEMMADDENEDEQS